jgi:hypothetical protein
MAWYSWKHFSGRWWLIVGLFSYLSTLLSSIVRAYDPAVSLALNATMVFDWFAACVVYFFLGALFGFIVDVMVAWRAKKKLLTPLWVWYTIGLWIFSSLYIAFVITPQFVDRSLLVIFPLPYGIFYTGGAFFILARGFVQETFWGKSFLDVLFTALFFYWLYAVIYHEKETRRAQFVCTLIIFVLFVIGLFGFAVALP